MRGSKVARLITVAIFFLIFIFYAWLRVENSQKIREPRASFGDVHEYFQVASQPFFSKSFWIAIRPPVIPLFYKYTGNDINAIANFQTWFSIFSWGLFATTVASASRSLIIKLVGFVVVLAFSLSQEIIMWDYLILSESISISLMVLFFTSSLLLIARWTRLRLVLFGVTGLLLVFARDAFGYYFLMVGLGLLAISFFVSNKKRLWAISAYLILLFLASNMLATSSARWYHSLLNTLAIRVLPNEQYVQYFASRGMPVNEALLSRRGKHLHADEGILMTDENLEEFRNWVRANGRREYIRFLWFYKADTLQNIFQDIKPLFNPNMDYYSATGFVPAIEDPRVRELLYPNRFSLFILLSISLLAAAAAVIAIYEKRNLWLLPLFLILLTYPQAVFIWNADANEIGRHSLYHNIQWRLGLWLLVLFGLDFMLERKPKLQIDRLKWDTTNET